MRPATDLCWTCQKNNNFIQKSVNMPESQKAKKQRLSGLRNSICNLLREKESFTRTVADNQNRTFTNTCKRLILTLDVHHAHTMEPNVGYHLYADDTQVYLSFKSTGDFLCERTKVEACLKDINSWMLSNNLKLNNGKTKLLG